MKRSILVKAGMKLAPDEFHIVMESEIDSKGMLYLLLNI